MSEKYNELQKLLRKEVVVATGCTEPIAVAYASSIAGEKIDDISQIKEVNLSVDAGLFKNGLRVGIPGIKDRGLEIATSLGLVIKKPEEKLRILENVAMQDIEIANDFKLQDKISIDVKGDCNRLFIEVFVTMMDGKQIKVVILDRHDNVIKVEEGYDLLHEDLQISSLPNKKLIQEFSLKDLMDFSSKVEIEKISFLQEGVDKNMKLALEGLSYTDGIGEAFKKIIDEGILNNHMVSRAEMLCAAASEARMSGSKLPAMSSAGSGNHGITVFLTISGAADVADIDEETRIRALAFGNLITVYIKSFTGTLSAMCGCGVAAGIGANAGVAYMLGATEEQVFKGMLNMVGSITGLICDGGKEGCAYKLALSAGWAVKSALFALKGVSVKVDDGILSDSFMELFENLGHVCNVGMAETNSSILNIMKNNKRYAQRAF